MIFFLFHTSLLVLSILNYAYWTENPSFAMFTVGWCSAMAFGAALRGFSTEARG